MPMLIEEVEPNTYTPGSLVLSSTVFRNEKAGGDTGVWSQVNVTSTNAMRQYKQMFHLHLGRTYFDRFTLHRVVSIICGRFCGRPDSIISSVFSCPCVVLPHLVENVNGRCMRLRIDRGDIRLSSAVVRSSCRGIRARTL